MNSLLKEALAKQAHRGWASWMEYLFSKCETAFIQYEDEEDIPENERHLADEYGTVGYTVIPHALVERWQRQMATEYEDLPEEEKDSDRAEAEKYWQAVRECGFGPF